MKFIKIFLFTLVAFSSINFSFVYAASVPTVGNVSLKTNPVVGSTASLSSPILHANGSAVSESGVVWSTSINPTTNLTTKTSRTYLPNYFPSGHGHSGESVTGLASDTTYYVRGYAINGIGVGYSPENLTFKTGKPDLVISLSEYPIETLNNGMIFPSGNVKNQGNYAANPTIYPHGQVATSKDGTGTKRDNIPAVTTIDKSLSPGISDNFNSNYASHSPSSVAYWKDRDRGLSFGEPRGTIQSYRICTDMKSSTDSGEIAESDESNNCFPWANILVRRAPSVSLTATPSGGNPGLTTTLKWSVSNLGAVPGYDDAGTTCTASGDWSGVKSFEGGTSALGPLNESKVYTYTLSCTNKDGTGQDTETVTVSFADEPNLQTSTVSLYKDNGAPMTATVGVAQDYYSTISNIGNAATNYKGVVSFKNLFQTTSGFDFTNGVIDYDKPNALVNYSTTDALSKVSKALSASPGTNDGKGNMSNEAQVAKSIFFNSKGDQWIRVCADKDSVASINGVIVESNEIDNCGSWKHIAVVIASSSGTLSVLPSTCEIAKDASTCTVTGAKWNTKNAVSPTLVDDNTGTTLSTLANNDVAPLKVWVSHPQTKFILKDGATPIEGATAIVTSSCIVGTEWDTVSSKCITDICLYDTGLQTSGPCVNPGPVDSLDGISCEIKLGEKNCTTTLELNIVSPVLGADTNVTKNTPVFNTEVIKSNDIKSFPTSKSGIVVDHPSTTFFLNHKMDTVAEKKITATCEEGTEWIVDKCIKTVPIGVDGVWGDPTYGLCLGCDATGNGGTQTVNRTCIGPTGNGKPCVGESSFTQSCSCPLPGVLITSFTASPEKIYKGRFTTLDWNSNADTCSMVDGKGIVLDINNKEKGDIKTSPTSNTSYKLTCSKGSVTETKQVDVKVIDVIIIER